MMKLLSAADVSMKLVELESHPGLEHLRRYSPTGVTAQRWALVEAALGQLWDHLTELEALSDSGENADSLERINAKYSEVNEFLDAVDGINAKIAEGIAPTLKQFDDAGAAIPMEITDLLAVSATDPLSLTADDVERQLAELAELAAMQANWPKAIATMAVQLDALRDAARQSAQTRARAEQTVVTGSLPTHTDPEPELRAELQSMTAPDPAALRELQRRIETALQHVQHDEELAQGLLDRRTELKGRLRAYEAKAARLGLAEDQDVLSSKRIASGLLSRQPCDLRAVTRAVTDYQQMVAEKREKTP
jgi:hypothetical protein